MNGVLFILSRFVKISVSKTAEEYSIMQISADILALSGEAFILIKYGKVFFANNAACDLLGQDCVGKTLKKLFAEAGIPVEARGLVPVVYDEAGVAAVCGFGAAERLTPFPGDRVTVIEFKESDNNKEKEDKENDFRKDER